MSNSYACCVIGTGSYLPERVLSNHELEKMVETSDDWITTRTGIKERRIAAEGQTSSQLGTEAARRALESAGITAEEVDLIIVATVTPDMPFPSTACLIQRNLGCINAAGFDISAACSGFLFALQTAKNYLKNAPGKTAIVVGTEVLSKLVNWTDRNTCVLFGDGAGAVVLRSTDQPEAPGQLLASVMATDGNFSHLLRVDRSPEVNQGNPYIHMEGRETFKHAVTCMLEAANQTLAQAGLNSSDVNLVIPHQANLRIINAVADRLNLSSEQAFVNVDKYGNTSAATIPIALDEANRSGRLKPNDHVLLVAFGGGFTWASSLIRW